MKKIVIISSTPRENGNSHMLCEEFKKGAEKSGNEVEIISLREKNLKFCIGCEKCQETGKCIYRDGMSKILEKVIKANVLVFATPIYFYNISGQLKTFMDRTLPKYKEIKDKDFYFIGTCSDRREEAFVEAMASIQGYLDSLTNVELKGSIHGTGAFELGEIKNSKAMKEAYKMGEGIK